MSELRPEKLIEVVTAKDLGWGKHWETWKNGEQVHRLEGRQKMVPSRH